MIFFIIFLYQLIFNHSCVTFFSICIKKATEKSQKHQKILILMSGEIDYEDYLNQGEYINYFDEYDESDLSNTVWKYGQDGAEMQDYNTSPQIIQMLNANTAFVPIPPSILIGDENEAEDNDNSSMFEQLYHQIPIQAPSGITHMTTTLTSNRERKNSNSDINPEYKRRSSFTYNLDPNANVDAISSSHFTSGSEQEQEQKPQYPATITEYKTNIFGNNNNNDTDSYDRGGGRTWRYSNYNDQFINSYDNHKTFNNNGFNRMNYFRGYYYSL